MGESIYISKQIRYNDTINFCEKFTIRQAFDNIMPNLYLKIYENKRSF